MQYSAINIQGNILTSDILEKIRIEDIKFQNHTDFDLDKNVSVRDEVGLAWSAIRAHWQAFSIRRDRLKETDTGTTETRQSWMIPFLHELGYDLEKSNAEVINGKSYAISHRSVNRDHFPVHIQGINQSLDKRAEQGNTRLSPHALVQEYLNNHDNLYAIVTNGRFLRLLRDATRLSRLSYLEFDLERILEEDLFSEFALLFRVLHVSRMPQSQDEGESSILEYYHTEALASGSRIRERLSGAVEDSLKLLANGILKHENSEELRQKLDNEELSAAEYYLYLLRVVYRILFLLVIEERNLIYPEERDEELARKRNIYYQFYSVGRVTKLVQKSIYVNPRKTDLWQSLLVTFRIFESNDIGKAFGILPLGSGLFAPNALGTLINQSLDNQTILQVLKHLVTFENENGQLSRVNYADLDVEEFGSVYEGLLDYDPKLEKVNEQWVFSFVEGSGRSSSGSHYTPEELVKPLIQHSLDHIIKDCLETPEKRVSISSPIPKTQAQEQALLSITIADVACGSGHVLLSAARKIALELARVRTNEDQPTPTAIRLATRDVIRSCIYGVDLNPLAVELCKVALWLEAHNPGEPLNFLDHHIKCGNAIVGLAHKEELEKGIANEAFKTLPGDEKEIASAWLKRNRTERKNHESKGSQDGTQLDTSYDERIDQELKEAQSQYEELIRFPEKTPQQIESKRRAYNQWLGSQGYLFLKTMADLQTAQFFYPKTEEYQNYLVTDADFRQMLGGKKGWTGKATAQATSEGVHRHFFHWFLEFPEVFEKGGFDCILGNPPFLGGQKLTGTFGNAFASYIRYEFAPIGSVDLVTYFFRRIFSIIRKGGFQSLISTNTIAQGSARVDGLGVISNNGGVINHAVRSMKWPGLAAVEVALVTVFKGDWRKSFVLQGNEVPQINTHLDDQDYLGDHFSLIENQDKSFQGSIVLGKGFILNKSEAQELIRKSPKNKEVVYHYLNGQDLNNRPDQSSSRWVINFKNWPLKRYSSPEWSELSSDHKSKLNEQLIKGAQVIVAPSWYGGPVACDYPDCIGIVESLVKPERTRWKLDKSGHELIEEYALRKPLPQNWWIYGEKRPKLYNSIKDLDKVIVVPRVSKYLNIGISLTESTVFSDATVIACYESKLYSVFQSTLMEEWIRKNGSTLETRMRVTPSESFESFPFPKDFYNASQEHLELKLNIAKSTNWGLTEILNQLHNSKLPSAAESLPKKEFEKKYGKESWSLYKHLELDKAGEISFEVAVQKIKELRSLHKKMDQAVLEAYGWHRDLPKWGPAIDLAHDFYEVNYLPENDNIRYTISPEARKEVLKRLLLLNHERYEEEIRQGLHKEKDAKAFYAQKGLEVPEEVLTLYDKTTRKKKSTQPKLAQPKLQADLFNQPLEETMKEFGLNEGIYSIRDTADIIGQSYDKVRRWFLKLSEQQYEGLDGTAKQDIDRRRISFHGLVELVVIGTLLENKMSIRKIFEARSDLGIKTGKSYPFATNNVNKNLHKAGGVLIYDFLAGHVTLDGTSQFNLTLIEDFFEDIVFDSSGIAQRLLPSKGNKRIVIDPTIGGGKPAFKDFGGLHVDTIMSFYDGPDSMEDLMDNYGVSKEDIEAALAYTS